VLSDGSTLKVRMMQVEIVDDLVLSRLEYINGTIRFSVPHYTSTAGLISDVFCATVPRNVEVLALGSDMLSRGNREQRL
jgi:hypothetical protein